MSNLAGIVIGLSLAGGTAVGAGLEKVKQNMNSVGDEIEKLNKTKLNIEQYKKLEQNSKRNQKQFKALGLSLKEAGIGLNNLDRESERLNKSLNKLEKTKEINLKVSRAKQGLMGLKNSIIGIGASLYSLRGIYSSASEVMKSQGEIASLGITKRGIDDITTSANKMSLQFGQITAPEYIRASYDIKSGIASLSEEGVDNFTKLASTTAVATKSSVAEMTKLYALGYGIFRDDFGSDLEFGEKFSGAISSAVQAFRTDGSDLAQGISNIGASAKAMGVSLEEELAIIGMSKSAFATAAEAGTGYRAFLAGVGNAQEKLGLEFTDAHGRMLPMTTVLEKIKAKYGELDLAEMGELKAAFGSEEAIKIITALMPRTKELADAQRNLAQSMALGSEQSEKMAKSMDQGYALEKLANAGSYLAYTIGKSLTPVFNGLSTVISGFASFLGWADRKFSFVLPAITSVIAGIVVGIGLMKLWTFASLTVTWVFGVLSQSLLIGKIRSVAFSMAIWAKNLALKVLSKNYLLTTTSIKGFSLATLIAGARTKALMVVGAVSGLLSKFATVTGIATAKQWLFNIALNANPIGLIIAGITALCGAVFMIYKYWNPIKQFFGDLWQGVADGATKLFDWLIGKFEWLGNAFKKIGSLFGFGQDEQSIGIGNGIKEFEKQTRDRKILEERALIPKIETQPNTFALADTNPIKSSQQQTNNTTNTNKHGGVNNNYSIVVNVEKPQNELDIVKAVKRALFDIDRDNFNRTMA